jgi:hypothetical protein
MKRGDFVRWTLRGAAALVAAFVVFGLTTAQANHVANIMTILVQGAAVYLFFFDQDLLARILLRVRRLMRKHLRRALARRRARAVKTAAGARATSPPPPPPQAPPSPLAVEPTPIRPTTPAQAPAMAQRAAEPPRILDTPDPAPGAPSEPPKRRHGLWPSVVGVVVAVGLVWWAIESVPNTDETPTPLPVSGSNETTPPAAVTPTPAVAPPAAVTPTPAPAAVDVPAASQEPWDYTAREGDSCWAIAERAARGDAPETNRLWLAIIELNRRRCPTDRNEIVAPGIVLRIPADVDHATLSTPYPSAGRP